MWQCSPQIMNLYVGVFLVWAGPTGERSNKQFSSLHSPTVSSVRRLPQSPRAVCLLLVSRATNTLGSRLDWLNSAMIIWFIVGVAPDWFKYYTCSYLCQIRCLSTWCVPWTISGVAPDEFNIVWIVTGVKSALHWVTIGSHLLCMCALRGGLTGGVPASCLVCTHYGTSSAKPSTDCLTFQ